MSLVIQKHVPKQAVDRTILRGIQLWEHANEGKKCPPHVVAQITKIVHTQASIMNIERRYGTNEARAAEGILRKP